MMLLVSVFTLACAALPPDGSALIGQNSNDVRVPFTAGLAEIYHDACTALVGGGDEAAQRACVDDAVSMVLQDVEAADYGRCDDLGGLLVSRIPACAQATLQMALLSDDSTISELLNAATAAHRLCTADVLCEGADPEPVPAAPDAVGLQGV